MAKWSQWPMNTYLFKGLYSTLGNNLYSILNKYHLIILFKVAVTWEKLAGLLSPNRLLPVASKTSRLGNGHRWQLPFATLYINRSWSLRQSRGGSAWLNSTWMAVHFTAPHANSTWIFACRVFHQNSVYCQELSGRCNLALHSSSFFGWEICTIDLTT